MSRFKNSYYRYLIVASILSAGCTSTDPVRVEDDFGNSVHNMIGAQIYDRGAAKNPPSDPPLALDGEKADKVLDVYRSDVSEPAKVEKPISIRIGGSR
jgi:type IV pilus biogenesis protein CpaD/CtpE